jgi:putative membrane protein
MLKGIHAKLCTTFGLAAILMGAPCAFAQAQDNDTTKDAETVGLLSVINQNEINSSQSAVNQARNAQVKEFANMMVREHSDNLTQTQALGITASENNDAQKMREKGQKEVEKLGSKDIEDFDKAYMKNMVKDHEEALKVIDKKIASTQNDQLKSHLMKTREHVSNHLNEAKKIQDQLK